ncbi:hypothetical protein E8E12_011707 [Didymella heteroderae]|uniref:Uncharacterized protein n=1 Tax=Didymella heteroderae TaxID=1769908 RepID=A0A9P4X2H4_9PLEO|nr:hypothetical protein E8E12_011707 [Didymella heteroderae]
MKASLAITALLSTFATALPTATILEPIEVRAVRAYPPFKSLPVQGPKALEARSSAVLDTRSTSIDARDARAATIFKSAGAVGESTFIPANNYCTNIPVVPGGEEGCGVNDFTGGGAVLEVGSRKYKDVRRRLGSWEGKIARDRKTFRQ